MVAAAMAIDTSVWVSPLSQAANGADFSALMGLAVGGGIYFVLARSGVRQEASARETTSMRPSRLQEAPPRWRQAGREAAAGSDYHRATSLAEAVEIKARYRDEASVLRAAESLVPMLNFRLARPAVIVDIGAVEALRHVALEKGVLRVGAMTPAANTRENA